MPSRRAYGATRAATTGLVAVNLSALQFAHTSLCQMVRDTLARHALEPRCLTLEVTESTAMHNADASLRILQQLSDMGVHFDRRFRHRLFEPALPEAAERATLKIDREFIRDLARAPRTPRSFRRSSRSARR